ncbi:MAG: hypothetical protein D6694_14460 [Gammaproteobacteria bacterium]|nr:MAG: hypothetical protein D6694_14460 [Gammaproteobacteria bacterium]
MLYRATKQSFTRQSVRFFVILVIFGFVVTSTCRSVAADGPVKAAVTDPDCPGFLYPYRVFSYNNVDEAVMDTIPGEWWPPASLGGTITFSGLEAAAVIIRSRILFQQQHPVNPAYNYTTANVDWQGGISEPSGCNDPGYTMNTAWNARRHSRSDYDSNGAVFQTSGIYIVNIGGSAEMVGFYPPIQKESTICAKQSDDWKFCAISALGNDITRSNNRYVRRLNISSPDWIEFQAEAFYERIDRSSHSWWCRTDNPGWSGKCYMRAEPNSGVSFGSDIDYRSVAPELRYRVAFPASDGITKWYIWILGEGCHNTDDALHVGLNSQRLDGSTNARGIAENVTGWDSCVFTWKSEMEDGTRPYINPSYYDTSSAFQTLNVWMKEDGMRIDRIILTTDPGAYIFKQFIPLVMW